MKRLKNKKIKSNKSIVQIIMERTIKHKLKRTHNQEKIRKQGSDYCRISCERCVLSCSLKACRPIPHQDPWALDLTGI